MGLMDKVKAQATLAAQKAQEAAQQGKGKLDQAQANRRGDAMLRQLGAVVFAERTGRAGPDSQAKMEQLISDISAHERENGLNLAGDQPQQTVPQQNFPAGSPGPFAGPPQPGANPGSGTSSFPDSSSSSLPDASSTSFPDTSQGTAPDSSIPFPDTSPRFFPGSDAGSEPDQGGTSAFPPES
jgi:hypothetical protein